MQLIITAKENGWLLQATAVDPPRLIEHVARTPAELARLTTEWGRLSLVRSGVVGSDR